MSENNCEPGFGFGIMFKYLYGNRVCNIFAGGYKCITPWMILPYCGN